MTEDRHMLLLINGNQKRKVREWPCLLKNEREWQFIFQTERCSKRTSIRCAQVFFTRGDNYLETAWNIFLCIFLMNHRKPVIFVLFINFTCFLPLPGFSWHGAQNDNCIFSCSLPCRFVAENFPLRINQNSFGSSCLATAARPEMLCCRGDDGRTSTGCRSRQLTKTTMGKYWLTFLMLPLPAKVLLS